MSQKNKTVTVKKAEQGQSVIINTLNIRPIQRANAEVSVWKNAIQAYDQGRRQQMYDLLEDLLADPRLSSVFEKRTLPITNSEWIFTDANGKENDIIKDLIDTTAFETILEEAANAVGWGHSLLEISKDAQDMLKSFLIPRKHVKPEKGIFVIDQNDTSGQNFRTPPYSNFVLECGKSDDRGLLWKAAPYVIFKRGNFSDWAQYAELFGMPLRIGKYDIEDVKGKLLLEQSLENSGSAAWHAIPTGTDLEVKESKSTGDGALYKELKNACNEEITILFLGQTMTTDNGSSKSQGEVHLTVEQSLHKKDRRRIRRILNQGLIPILANLGYPVQGGKFNIKDESKLSVKERIEILDMVKANVPVSDDEYYDVSGTPKPDNYDELKKEKQNPEPPTPPEPTPAPPPTKAKKDKPKEKKIKLSWLEKFSDFFDKAE